MEVRRNERLGLLEVWVPRSERGLEETRRRLDALCAACKGTCTRCGLLLRRGGPNRADELAALRPPEKADPMPRQMTPDAGAFFGFFFTVPRAFGTMVARGNPAWWKGEKQRWTIAWEI